MTTTTFECVKCEANYEISQDPRLRKIQSNPDYAICFDCFDGVHTFTCDSCASGLATQEVNYSNGWREWWCSSCCEDASEANLSGEGLLSHDKDNDCWNLIWTEPDFLLNQVMFSSLEETENNV